MSVPDDFAYRQAFDLVKTALQSGAIKLKGVDGTDYAVPNGTADAAYLVALIEGLASALPK